MRPSCKSKTYDRRSKKFKAVLARKKAVAQGVGGKPTNVKTFAKRKKAMVVVLWLDVWA